MTAKLHTTHSELTAGILLLAQRRNTGNKRPFWALHLATERIQNIPSGHYTWRQTGYKMSLLGLTLDDRNYTKCPFWALHLATERIQNVPSEHYTWRQKGYKISLLGITLSDRKDTKCPFWALHLATERI